MPTETLSGAELDLGVPHEVRPTGRASTPAMTSPAALSPDAQRQWAQRSISTRLQVLRRTRHQLATLAPELSAAISPLLARTPADTMVAEILPLLDAIRFLEQNAAPLLRPRRLGRRGLPFWLSGVHAEVHRAPLGRVLVIGPANYTLFLPGVQAMQALAAGNSVVWKPGAGGAPVAHLVAEALERAGLPQGLLAITDDSITAAQEAIDSGVDKVFFTGSATTGRRLLHRLAETLTPCVAELSGNDAAVVLPCANLDRVIAALTFGMRFNGSATCMAPRRVLLVDCPRARRTLFLEQLQIRLAQISGVTLPEASRRHLFQLVTEAEQNGATVIGDVRASLLKPLLLVNATPGMRIAQEDIFAPVLLVLDVNGESGAIEAQRACPLALTTSIFGDERAARDLARHITCGAVTINGLIVSTADPRIPFGGRRGSGFGVTRGAEGLLEMTAVKVISASRSRSNRQYEPTGATHAALFSGLLTAVHAGRSSDRWNGVKRVIAAARELKKK